MTMRPLPAATAAVAAEMSAERSLLSSPAHTMTSTPTHTSCTEGTPSYTTSSPSCCSSELTGRNVSIDYLLHLPWSMLNRFRTGRGTCRADLHQWGLSTSESCSCGQKQTMSYIVDSCPLSRFEGGLQPLHTADDRAVHWLETAAKKALAK